MKTRMKGNNKGFSLVELIVVMAIMAILAVTLAPRLGHYVDKARQASDREAVNTFYTAVKYSLMDESIYAVIKSDAEATDLTKGIQTSEVQLYDYNDDADATKDGFDFFHTMYTGANGKYTIAAIPTTATDKFYDEVKGVVGDSFLIKSSNWKAATKLVLKITDQNTFSLTFDYDGDLTTTGDQYVLDSTK